MKIQIASDLHIEFHPPGFEFNLEQTAADVIVLAGDIGVGFQQEADFCERLSQEHQKEVLFVLGNHSFYGGGNVDRIRQQWAEADIIGVNYIDEKYNWVFDENDEQILFTGGILWTDFDKGNAAAMYHAEKGMNDYRGCKMDIYTGEGTKEQAFTPLRSAEEHNKTKKWIEYSVDELFADKKIVISHHLPCIKSISEEFQRYPENTLNPAYVSDMEEWIKERKGIDLWIHGHTHNSFDYTLDNGTRIVCNPRGYINYAENEEFNKSLVVEI